MSYDDWRTTDRSWEQDESDYHHQLDIEADADTWREFEERELESEEEIAA